MPLIIGSLEASITVVDTPAASAAPKNEMRDEFMERIREQAARRFEDERKVDQRDPDFLGGR